MNLVRLTSDYELTSFDCGDDQLQFFLSPLLLISLATDATMQFCLTLRDLRVARAVARVARAVAREMALMQAVTAR